MQLSQSTAEIYIPDGVAEEDALARTTHLGIGAHQDDLEFMALHGILACYQQPIRWFGGITVTDGGGSSRVGGYTDYTDAQMRAVRRQEQRQAASIGQYGFMAQLDHPSVVVKTVTEDRVDADLRALLMAAGPEVVYTHSPADKHDTHVAVMGAVLRAIRSLPVKCRPKQVLGCEVWRDLDWVCDDDKVVLDVSGREHLAAALNGVFDSQIAGGKRYDLAVAGRRRANATFFQSHATDSMDQVWFALDLTPLVHDEDAPSVEAFTQALIQRFSDDVSGRLRRFASSHL
ncbi:MAG TPA: PIG-L family deacetylase [Verrucomicrobia bacterium]|nr:PIG-L family deacetylase [Verrucomicrobiota bacterium]